MKPRSKKTLQKYGMTEDAFAALWQSQGGCCAICGVSEEKLTEKHQDWAADQVLHIDHEHGTYPYRVRGLLCKDCNFDLEAYIRKAIVVHPAGRGESRPRNDPRFREYLKRTAGPPVERRESEESRPERKLLAKWSGKPVKVTFKDGSVKEGTLLINPEDERTFILFGPPLRKKDYDNPEHPANKLYRASDVAAFERNW